MSIIRSLFDTIVGETSTEIFFDEPEVARYVTINETFNGVTIPDPFNPISDRHIEDIKMPGWITSSIPILFFRIRHTGSPRFSIRINSTPLIRHKLAEAEEVEDPVFAPGISWHIFIPLFALKIDRNVITLAAFEGTVTFLDMAILYKSNELVVRKTRPFPR